MVVIKYSVCSVAVEECSFMEKSRWALALVLIKQDTTGLGAKQLLRNTLKRGGGVRQNITVCYIQRSPSYNI